MSTLRQLALIACALFCIMYIEWFILTIALSAIVDKKFAYVLAGVLARMIALGEFAFNILSLYYNLIVGLSRKEACIRALRDCYVPVLGLGLIDLCLSLIHYFTVLRFVDMYMVALTEVVTMACAVVGFYMAAVRARQMFEKLFKVSEDLHQY